MLSDMFKALEFRGEIEAHERTWKVVRDISSDYYLVVDVAEESPAMPFLIRKADVTKHMKGKTELERIMDKESTSAALGDLLK